MRQTDTYMNTNTPKTRNCQPTDDGYNQTKLHQRNIEPHNNEYPYPHKSCIRKLLVLNQLTTTVV